MKTAPLLAVALLMTACAARTGSADTNGGEPVAPRSVHLEIRVDPHGTERGGEPLCITLRVGKDLDRQAAQRLGPTPVAHLRTAGGGRIEPVQAAWTDSGHSVLDIYCVPASLEKATRYELDLAAGDGAANGGFSVRQAPGHRDLVFGATRVLRHMDAWDPARRAATYKHFHHVFGLHGEGLLTKGPGGLYTHHRGIFAGWRRVRRGDEAWDFWSCARGVTQRHKAYVADLESLGPVVARTIVDADWVTAAGEPVVRERRTLHVWRPRGGCEVIDIDLRLEAVGGTVRLDGDPHHGGCQIRLVDAAAKPAGKLRYIRSTGATPRGNDIWRDCAWAACSFDFAGHAYLIAHFDDPRNPRPMLYSTRPYGRFGSFFRATLEAGEPRTFHYRIVVLDRDTQDTSGAAIADRYARFAEPPQVVVTSR